MLAGNRQLLKEQIFIKLGALGVLKEYLWIIFGDWQHGFYCYVPFSLRSDYHLKVY
jgi:hypothetical protein